MATKRISIGPILFLYYEKSLVSSNLNSKQLRFHGAHPNVRTAELFLAFQICGQRNEKVVTIGV